MWRKGGDGKRTTSDDLVGSRVVLHRPYVLNKLKVYIFIYILNNLAARSLALHASSNFLIGSCFKIKSCQLNLINNYILDQLWRMLHSLHITKLTKCTTHHASKQHSKYYKFWTNKATNTKFGADVALDNIFKMTPKPINNYLSLLYWNVETKN